MKKPRAGSEPRITIAKDGPYRVSSGVALSKGTIGADEAGESIDWIDGADLTPEKAYFLCRCGHSTTKPFCDGSHTTVGFDGAETASRESYTRQARGLQGPDLVLSDAQSLCASARFCDRAGKVWNTVFEATTSDARDAFTAQVGQCPSGRLGAWDRATGEAIEPSLPMSIVVVEDPQQGVAGPLWVRGGIEIVGSDGEAWEVRNRVTLCRCGASRNKPFCDGSHETIKFQDT